MSNVDLIPVTNGTISEGLSEYNGFPQLLEEPMMYTGQPSHQKLEYKMVSLDHQVSTNHTVAH